MTAGRLAVAANVAPPDHRVFAERDRHWIVGVDCVLDVLPHFVERRRFEDGEKPSFARDRVERSAEALDVIRPDADDLDRVAAHRSRPAASITAPPRLTVNAGLTPAASPRRRRAPVRP